MQIYMSVVDCELRPVGGKTIFFKSETHDLNIYLYVVCFCNCMSCSLFFFFVDGILSDRVPECTLLPLTERNLAQMLIKL